MAQTQASSGSDHATTRVNAMLLEFGGYTWAGVQAELGSASDRKYGCVGPGEQVGGGL